MDFKDFVVGVLKNNLAPEGADTNIAPLKALSDVHDLVTIYYIDREADTVSALHIDEFFPIDENLGGVIKGEWELGGYNRKEDCFYSMGRYTVSRFQPEKTFVTQERIDKGETYIRDRLRDTDSYIFPR